MLRRNMTLDFFVQRNIFGLAPDEVPRHQHSPHQHSDGQSAGKGIE